MIKPNCILATLAAFVVMFVLGYIIYEPLLGDFFAANAGTATGVIKENPVFWQIIVGQLCGAALLVTVLSWKGVESAADGFRGGAIFGLLLSLFYGFMNLGTMNTSTINAALAGRGHHGGDDGGGWRGGGAGVEAGVVPASGRGNCVGYAYIQVRQYLTIS